MRMIIACALLALAACGDAPADPTVQNQQAAGSEVGGSASEPDSAALLKQTPEEQRSLLAKAVIATDNSCSSPSRAEYKGDGEGEAYWAVKCAEEEYLVSLRSSDGSRRVVTCATAKAADLDCWKQW